MIQAVAEEHASRCAGERWVYRHDPDCPPISPDKRTLPYEPPPPATAQVMPWSGISISGVCEAQATYPVKTL